MKITLESTSEIVEIERSGKGATAVQARVWKGRTAAGVPIRAFISLIQVERDEDQSAFVRELEEQHPKAAPRVFPTRFFVD